MAKAISEEQLQLRKRARRRLIGAIALVTIVAVFVPMVLDHEPRPVKQDISIQIPPQNSGTFTSKIVPVVPESKNDAKAGIQAAPPVETRKQPELAATATPPTYDSEAAPANESKDKPSRAKPAAKPVTPAAATANKTADKAPATEPAAKATAATASVNKSAAKAPAADHNSEGYVVQVAALNDAEKAKQMQQQISATGVQAYTEVVPTKKGNVTRVRAGPFATRDEAEKVRAKFKDLGLSGNIVPKGS